MSITITQITEHPRKPGRFQVHLDGTRHATVGLELIVRLELRVGRSMGEAELAELDEGARALATYDRALAMLAVRGRPARELRRRLVQKGEEAVHVDAAIARLEANGLLDDRAYAVQSSRSKLAAGVSRRRVRDELTRRGVDRTLADEAVAEVAEEDAVDERDAALTAARRKVATLGRTEPLARRRRLYAFLARRGFAADDIRAAMEIALQDVDAADGVEATDDALDQDGDTSSGAET